MERPLPCGFRLITMAHGYSGSLRLITMISVSFAIVFLIISPISVRWFVMVNCFVSGFGVYFEYGTPTTDQVSVHISESDDEDGPDLEDLDEEVAISPADYEAGTVSSDSASRALIMEVVPVYRRDCQNEVYAGSHNYPGEGVYLLKFDNSYSLWRSKTLYYRVYYSH